VNGGGFTGKTVWVTGAETPVGRAVAELFYEEGATLLLSGVTSADLPGNGRECICYADNPINEEHAGRAVSLIDRLDVAVAANRYVKRGSLIEGTAGLFDEMMEQNLFHAFCTARAAAGKMGKTGGGAVLFINSIHGEKPTGSAPLYSVACGGVNMLVKEAAQDFGRLGIRVNQLKCGPLAGDEELFFSDKSGIYHGAAARVPRGALGTPREIARAALFLCSDAASFINGAALTADGGFLGFYLHGDSERRWDIGYADKGTANG